MANNISIIKSQYKNEEEIFNKEHCFLFKPGNEYDLLNRMEESINNEEKRKRLIANSRQSVIDKFSMNNVISKYLRLLENL